MDSLWRLESGGVFFSNTMPWDRDMPDTIRWYLGRVAGGFVWHLGKPEAQIQGALRVQEEQHLESRYDRLRPNHSKKKSQPFPGLRDDHKLKPLPSDPSRDLIVSAVCTDKIPCVGACE